PAPAAAAPAPAAANGGGPLSDADVDRIARRVVELLGDKAVRDVAWEVIPDMAEVIIRDRLRELESQVEYGPPLAPPEAHGERCKSPWTSASIRRATSSAGSAIGRSAATSAPRRRRRSPRTAS